MANENQTTPQPGQVQPVQQAAQQQAVQPQAAQQPQAPVQQVVQQTAPIQPPVQPMQAQPQPVQQPLQQAQPQMVPAQPVQQAPVQQMQQPAAPQYAQQAQPQRPPMQSMPMQNQPPQMMQQPGMPLRPAGIPVPQPPMQQRPMPGAPGQPPVRKPPNPKRLIGGCLGCFGGAILLFVVLVLIFVAQTSATGENPMAKSLGMNTGDFINTLITIVNLIFGALAVALFLLAVIGTFRFAMSRKDDKDNKKKGLTMAGVSALILFITILIWVGLYAFMSSKKVAQTRTQIATAIETEPADILNQVAPFEVKFKSPKTINTTKFDILSYAWNFGDGSTETIPEPSHTYADMGKGGRFDVTLDITKRDKQTKEESVDKYTTVVTIAKVLSPSFIMDKKTGPAPLTINFDASGSVVTGGQIAAYDWDFKGTNNYTDASGAKVSYTFDQIGTYNVSLRISDSSTPPVYRTISQEVTVEGSNIPTAVIDIPTKDGKYLVGTQYTFLGEKSSSPAGAIQKYTWDFGDGTAKANTRTATHTYKTAGNYEVILEIVDEQGTKAQASQKIKLEQAATAPIAVIKTVPGPAGDKEDFISGTIPFEVSFDATGTQDPDNNIVEYKWDFDGDGEFDSSGEKTTYVYKKDGVYNATLTVIDADNNESKAVLVVKVGTQPLQARITANPIEGVAPLTVTFDASASSYPDGQIVSYEWDFGDGSAKRIDVAQVTYKYSKIGTFTAKVTAIASDNSRSTAETPVNIRPVALTSCFVATPEQGAAPLVVEFDPKCSTGTVAKYSWDFGDNSTSRTRKPTHTYNTPGSYEVVLEVADNQNVVNKFSKTILVTGTI